jgi:hypothetical protein
MKYPITTKTKKEKTMNKNEMLFELVKATLPKTMELSSDGATPQNISVDSLRIAIATLNTYLDYIETNTEEQKNTNIDALVTFGTLQKH